MGTDVLYAENKYTAAYGDTGYSDTKNALAAKGVICAESGETIVKKHNVISVATLFISLDKKSDLSEFCSDMNRATKENDVVFVCVSYTETGEKNDAGGMGGGRKKVISYFCRNGMASVMPFPLSSVHSAG